MKLIHIADLHFGKSLHGLSMIDQGDQPRWVEQFLELAEAEKPDAVLMAGDVYDRGAPGDQAVELLDRLLTGLAGMRIPVLMVSGNHDSGTKLAFAGKLLEASDLYIAGSIHGGVKHITLNDEFGPVHFWLMPYVFPALVAAELGDDSFRDYDTAVRRLLEAQNIDFTQRNVLIAHQNVLAGGNSAQRGGSETMVGGVGEIDAAAFDGFDYVALGHIHAAQAMGKQTVRYAGSPLCYHFSELRNPKKGPIVIELGEKGTEPAISTRLFQPLHPLREIVGTLPEILQAEQDRIGGGEYIRVVLHDDHIPADAGAQLKALLESKGSKLLDLSREPKFTGGEAVADVQAMEKGVEELFCDFFQDRTGELPDDAQKAIIDFVADQMSHPGSREADADDLIRFAMGQEDAQ